MKKLCILAAIAAVLGFSATSCGGGENREVNNDTVVSAELSDSMSVALGAFLGVDCQNETAYIDNLDDYIEGYQMMVGQEFSPEKLMGMRQGLFVAEQFMNYKAEGININRHLFLQQFRNYVQKVDIDQKEYSVLYTNLQNVVSRIENILSKREQMRNEAAGEDVTAVVEETEQGTPDEYVEEVEEDVTVETATSEPSTASSQTPTEEETLQTAI